MPPMATTGSGIAATTSRKPAIPTTGSGRSLLLVANTGPKPM